MEPTDEDNVDRYFEKHINTVCENWVIYCWKLLTMKLKIVSLILIFVYFTCFQSAVSCY